MMVQFKQSTKLHEILAFLYIEKSDSLAYSFLSKVISTVFVLSWITVHEIQKKAIKDFQRYYLCLVNVYMCMS